MYFDSLVDIVGRSSSGAHGFVLQTFLSGGLALGHIESMRLTLWSCAIVCLHKTVRFFCPPPQDFAQRDLRIVNWTMKRLVCFQSSSFLARLQHLPFANFPARWTIEHVAVLPIWRWWLWTHAVWNNHRVLTATRHLVDAVYLARLDANAARASARCCEWRNCCQLASKLGGEMTTTTYSNPNSSIWVGTECHCTFECGSRVWFPDCTSTVTRLCRCRHAHN